MKFVKALFAAALALSACLANAQYVRLDQVVFQECVTAAVRTKEQTLLDMHQMSDIFAKQGEVAVPERYVRVFESLVRSSPELAGYQLRLRAYHGKGINAHEADHGVILVSDSAWTRAEPLSDSAFAAMVGHELAHLLVQDARTASCQLLALTGSPQLTLRQAVDAVGPEMMETTSELAQTLRRWSQDREFAADAVGTKLLARAGFNPSGMLELLTTIAPPQASAFDRGSHPEFDARIASAQRAYREVVGLRQVSLR